MKHWQGEEHLPTRIALANVDKQVLIHIERPHMNRQ